ncbi:g3518 [Coccomyxa viridis]|uniref:G3518 protein n=1 Tax=Coccomyxa viridis TaxID=1274662 RepID=A0ABP1FUV5_9CHLO
MHGPSPTSPGYYSHVKQGRHPSIFLVILGALLGACGLACFCWQGLVQYAAAKPLIDQLFQAPGSFAGAYKAVVIAVTCAGGVLILLCLAMASAVRRWDSSADDTACCSGLTCMLRTNAALLYIYNILLVLAACVQATGTVYLWDARYSIDNIDQTSGSGAALQSGCTQLTLFARTAPVCEGTNGQQLQTALQAATIHATCTLAGLLAMYVAFSLLMALMSTRAGRSQADVHYVLLNAPGKSQSPPDSCTGGQCGQWTFMCSHACPSSPTHASAPSAPAMPGYTRDEHLYNQHDFAASRV